MAVAFVFAAPPPFPPARSFFGSRLRTGAPPAFPPAAFAVVCHGYTEKKVLKFLRREFRGKVEHSVRFDWSRSPRSGALLEFDFVLRAFGVICELDGRQHFRQVLGWKPPAQRRARDVQKIQDAVHHGYTIIHIAQPEVAKDLMPWEEELARSIEDPEGADATFISLDPGLYDEHVAGLLRAEGGGAVREVTRYRQTWTRPEGRRFFLPQDGG